MVRLGGIIKYRLFGLHEMDRVPDNHGGIGRSDDYGDGIDLEANMGEMKQSLQVD